MDKVYSHCRLCAVHKPITKLVDLIFDDDKRSDIATKLTYLNSSVRDVFEINSLPKTVCFVCINILNNAYDFIISIETAQKVLRNIYATDPLSIKSECLSASDDDQHNVYPVENIVQSLEPDLKPKIKKEKAKRTENVKLQMTWNDYSWACSQCDTVFPTLDELQTHTITIHNLCNRYKCTYCSTFKNRSNLDKLILHIARKHKNDLKYSCYKCNLQFDTPQMCSRHKLEHKHPQLSCRGCNITFSNLQELNEHKNKYYKGINQYRLPKTPIADSLTCPICNVKCISRYLFLRHMSQSHSDVHREFMCDTCGKCFYLKKHLAQHSLVHTELRLYKCDKCDYCSKSPDLLRSHDFVHNRVKPFRCTDCDKTFRKKCELNMHRVLHTGETPHTCVYCQKAFRWKPSLIQHIRQHTGERPYKCEHCSKTFTNWPNYRKHTKGVHGINELVKRKSKMCIKEKQV